jgi:hypothetical protein
MTKFSQENLTALPKENRDDVARGASVGTFFPRDGEMVKVDYFLNHAMICVSPNKVTPKRNIPHSEVH